MGKVVVEKLKPTQSKFDPTFFYDVTRQILLVIYVDDMLLFAPEKIFNEIVAVMKKEISLRIEYNLSEPGAIGWMLGRNRAYGDRLRASQ